MFDVSAESIVVVESVSEASQTQTSWEEVDHALRELARSRSALDADEARLLAIAVRDEIWRKLGRASLLEYLEDVLGYSPRQASERVRVAKELAAMPLLEDALATNMLHWSAVRELSRVATPATVDSWLDAARGKNLRQIEALVAGHIKGDKPDDPPNPDHDLRKIALLLTPETIALLRVGRQRIEEERGEPIDDDTLIRTAFRAFVDDASGESNETERGLARFQIMTVLCPTCDAASHEAAGRRYPIDAASREIALCDAQWIGSDREPQRATQDVSPKTRRFVHRRDGGKCTVPGCRASRFIDVHHIVPRHLDGPHDADNLTLLCDGHHRALHDGKLTITGKAPHLDVQWTTRTSANPRAPEVAVAQQRTLVQESRFATPQPARPSLVRSPLRPSSSSSASPAGLSTTRAAGPALRATSSVASSHQFQHIEAHAACVRDAKQAIVQLGFNKDLADSAVEATWRIHGPSLELERLIYFALRSMSTATSR